MTRTGPAGLALLAEAFRVATLIAALMLAIGTWTLLSDVPAAADGSEGTPALRPDRVEAASEPFALVPPEGAACAEDGAGRSGNDGWRWHTFIVEAGRDPATLDFGPFGPGRDFDATDGEITAPLIATGRGVWSRPPAEQPKGLIDPGDLGGLLLDPDDYQLRDGDYLLGFACTDATSATRQWWTIEVTVQAAAAPFLTVAGAAEAPPADPATTTTAPAASGTGDGAAPQGPAPEVPVDQAEVDEAARDGVATAATGPAQPIGVSWSPLVSLRDASSLLPVGGWAALVVVLARITYLLARPVRVLSPLAP